MTPMQRYEAATGPDGWLTVAGWEDLAGYFYRRAAQCRDRWQGGLALKWEDRARDCGERAAALRAA